MGDEQRVQKLVTTRMYLDKQREPWEYVEEELPTTTVKLGWPQRRGAKQRATQGTSSATAYLVGSFRVTGSHYQDRPGTYSLRITRLSIGVQGTATFHGTTYEWYIRHSRVGTIDQIPFGEQGRVFEVGHPRQPIYAFGPGTVLWGWLSPQAGTHVSLSQSLEGVVG